MASILKPFSNILSPNKLQVPAGANGRIDWTNQLTNSLIGCWVPGLGGPVDLTGITPLGAPASSYILDSTAEGVGMGTGAAFAVISQPVPASIYENTSLGYSLFYRAYQVSVMAASIRTIGISYDPGGQPFSQYTIDNNGAGNWRLGWDSGGTFNSLVGSAMSAQTGTMFDLAGVFNPAAASTQVLYLNGAVNASGTAGGPLNMTVTSVTDFLVVGTAGHLVTIACVWNRMLSADEVFSLHVDPYQFLVPAEYDMPIMLLPPPPFFTIRKQVRLNILQTGP